MENYYELLGCERTASYDELKRAYYKLVKKYHPDRNKNLSFPVANNNSHFQEIDKAWKTLREQELRKIYDEQLIQREMDKECLLYTSLKLDQLSYDLENETYLYPCKCGGQYCFCENDIEKNVSYLVNCDTCSLVISIEF